MSSRRKVLPLIFVGFLAAARSARAAEATTLAPIPVVTSPTATSDASATQGERADTRVAVPSSANPTYHSASRQQDAVPSPESAGAPAPDTLPSGPPTKLSASGYAETYFAWNFNNPENRVSNFRAFDNRHNTFVLSNAVVSLEGETHGLFARIALQAGLTGETYYAAEPAFTSTDGAGPTGAEVFKHVQEAYAGATLPFAPRIKVDAGVFLSPIGPESMAIKDTFLWSRSNLFYALPFYHTGARVAYQATPGTMVRAAVYNGWNSIVDNNDEKTLSLKVSSRLSQRVAFDAQYMTGVERAPGAYEGRAWRQLLDVYVAYEPTDRVSLIANLDVGVEPNRLGTSGWVGGAIHGRVKWTSWLYTATRVDALYEARASNGIFYSERMFWPVDGMGSVAIAFDLRPHPQVSIRPEFRHDAATGDAFFRGKGRARVQDTLTLGLTAWF